MIVRFAMVTLYEASGSLEPSLKPAAGEDKPK